MIGRAILVFGATLLADVAWANYTIGVADRRPFLASAWSAIIILLGAVTVLVYTKDPLMVFPAAAGAFAGTWIAVRK